MKLKELQDAMIAAMKAKDKFRKDAISALVSAVKKKGIDNGCRDNIPDEMANEAILKEIKSVKEQIDTCPADRTELLEEYKKRYEIMSEFAPKMLSAEEVKSILEEKFADVLATKNKGQIMKAVMAELKGNKYGTHRVIEPKGVLTQAAWKVDNDMSKVYSNEIVCDVTSLNIDSASFTQIAEACGGDEKKIGEMILGIVAERGKQQNPVTGSGGMFKGVVSHIGEDLKKKPGFDLKEGDKIVSLVSLSMTPLRIDKILAIHKDIDRVDIEGKAILFESALYAKMPEDMSEPLALAALDVAGAPAQARKLPHEGDSVLILGANGKSGVLCGWEAMKKVGPNGKVVGVVRNPKQVPGLLELGVYTDVIVADCTKPVEVMEAALAANDGKEYDLSICCVNIESCEMSAILPVHDDGLVYFFSMATSFTKAALGAEGIGKDVTMIIGNGYTKNHAQITLDVLRENPKLRKLFDEKYC